MLVIIAVALPLLELVGIYHVWGMYGAWTLAWLLLAVLLGMWLMALERLAFLPRLLAAMAQGGAPLGVLTGSGLRFIAAGLFMFPGFFSDAAGLLLLLASLVPGLGARSPQQAATGARHGPRAANDDVIEGEFHRVDP